MTVLLPAWLQVGSYSAEIDRYVPTALTTPATDLNGRGGVRRWSDDALRVVQTSTASMQVQVNAGIGFVAGGYAAQQGIYTVVNDSIVTLTIDPANSNPRVDLVVLEVLDQSYSGSSNLAQLRVVKGTPSASPTAPSVIGSYLTLAAISVAANATSLSNASIADTRSYTAALGGMISSQTETTMNALPALASGQLCYVISTGRIYKQLSGGGWEYVAGANPPVVAIPCAGGWYYWSSLTGGNDPWEELRVVKQAGVVHVQGLIGNTNAFSANALMFNLPVGYRPERIHMTSIFTGVLKTRRVDVNVDGNVYALPFEQHPANDYWAVDIHFNSRNHSVG